MFDYLIIGGGIVGLSSAWQLQQRCPGAKILLLEKEPDVARHQSGHNSGVIHAGIYYEPGSLKATFCKRGLQATLAFCRTHNIPFEQCGKLLVATTEVERVRMLALHARALENGLDAQLLDAAQLHQKEPRVAGLGAIYLRSTGIVDYREICRAMAEEFRARGGEIWLGREVTAIAEGANDICVTVAGADPVRARQLVACGGLMADRLTRMQGIETDFRIVPYRGEYYRLAPSHNDIVKHLIYPIPDPALPFLGVHLTPMIDGTVTVGPNAVQGWKREGYGRINLSLRDTWDLLSFPGFWRVTRANLKAGIQETWHSLWKPGYLKRVQKYCPSLRLADLQPYPAGIRAQAVLRDGTLVHDFLFKETPRSLHVCNAPSPAATSAIPIGNYICDRLLQGA